MSHSRFTENQAYSRFIRMEKKVTIFIYFIIVAYNRRKDVFNGISSSKKFSAIDTSIESTWTCFGRPKFRAKNIMSAT